MAIARFVLEKPGTKPIFSAQSENAPRTVSLRMAILFQRAMIDQRIAWAVRALEKRRTRQQRKWEVAFMYEESLVIALHSSLTAAEKALSTSPAGFAQVRQLHQTMFSNSQCLMQKIKNITGMNVNDITAKIDFATGHVVQLLTTTTIVPPFEAVAKKPALLRPNGPGSFKNNNGTRTTREVINHSKSFIGLARNIESILSPT